jgi:hypothetical protein
LAQPSAAPISVFAGFKLNATQGLPGKPMPASILHHITTIPLLGIHYLFEACLPVSGSKN